MPVCFLPGRALLTVSGEDRASFLQGLVSNDVTLAMQGAMQGVWTALLTPQGKWLADFFVQERDGRLWLDVEAGQAEMIQKLLSRFRLRSKVAIAAEPGRVWAGWGGAPMPENAFADPRHPAAGWRGPAPEDARPDAEEAAYDAHRLAIGLPDGSRDMEAEKSVLLEAGFDELNGVSWSKGCYMGQELTARTKYRGLVKRRLVPVAVEGPLPPRGTAITGPDGTELGEMRSGRESRGLALLRLEALRGLAPLACGEARLTPDIPAWMKLPEASDA